MKILLLFKKNKDTLLQISLLLSFLLLAALKLFLVSNNEILAIYSPYDSLWHINAASYGYWFSKHYDQLTAVQFPVYSFFILLNHAFGIPLRNGIEIFYILSAFIFSTALIRMGLRRIYSLLIFTFIIFNPLTFSLFDFTLAETVYAPLLLCSLSLFIFTWLEKNNPNFKALFFSALNGIFLSLLWFTRKESILIFAFMLFILSLICLSFRENKKILIKYSILLFFIPTLFVFASIITVDSINYYKYKFFATSALTTTAYTSAYDALQKIDTNENIQFVPISTKAREIAYEISPSFAELRPFLENKNNFAFYWSEKDMGIKNEMAGGWFYWILRDAVYNAGYKSSQDSQRFYNRIAKDINKAIEEKRIKSRLVPISFMDPSFYKYLNSFPRSFFNIVTTLFSTNVPPIQEDEQNLPQNLKNLVDKYANRRSYLVNNKNTNGQLKGWVAVNNEAIKEIRILDKKNKTLSSTKTLDFRPDIQTYLSENNMTAIGNGGFAISYGDTKNKLANAQFEIITDVNSYVFPFDKMDTDKQFKLDETNLRSKIIVTIEEKTFPSIDDNYVKKIQVQNIIWSLYNNILYIITVLAAILSIVAMIIRKGFDLYANEIGLVAMILLFIIVTRISLFSLVDISSWSANQPRYLFPIMPLLPAFIFIILNISFDIIIKKIKNT